MNFWKQTTHVMTYFKEENFRGAKRLPSSFIEGFLEVSHCVLTLPIALPCHTVTDMISIHRAEISQQK